MEKVKITKFNNKNQEDYLWFIKNSKIPTELALLKKQQFCDKGKAIFVLYQKIFPHKNKVIGYCIVEDLDKLSENKNENIRLLFGINKENQKDIYISDLIIAKKKRRKGLGTKLASYVINEAYPNRNFVLHPDGAGYSFWIKLGFLESMNQQEEWQYNLTQEIG